MQSIGKLRPDAETWIGRADSLQAGSTFALLAQALRGALGIVEGEPLPARRAALEAGVGEVVAPALRQGVVEFLGELTGVSSTDDGASPALRAARQDPLAMGDHLRNAWITFLSARLARRPILLVLEDLHWGDLSTVRFIDAALRELGEAPLTVLALARPEIHELGIEQSSEGRALFHSIGHQLGIAIAEVLQAWCWCTVGVYAEGERLVLSSLASGRDIGLVSSLRPGVHTDALLGLGRHDEAIEVARAGAADGQARGLEVHEGRCRWALARVYLSRGRLAEAEEELALALRQVAAVPPDHSAVGVTIAAVHLARGRAEEALAGAESALRALGAQGVPGFGAAAARLIIAEAQHALGDPAAARATVDDARAR